MTFGLRCWSWFGLRIHNATEQCISRSSLHAVDHCFHPSPQTTNNNSVKQSLKTCLANGCGWHIRQPKRPLIKLLTSSEKRREAPLYSKYPRSHLLTGTSSTSWGNSCCRTRRYTSPVKADSHIARRAHAVPLPWRAVNSQMPYRAPAVLRQCRVLRESPRGSRKLIVQQFNTSSFFCSVLLPLFIVVGMDCCEEDWYASDNNLRGTPRGSRKKPNAGR